MEITLKDGTKIKLLAINLTGGSFDWQRLEGYTGACQSYADFSACADAVAIEEAVRVALAVELGAE